MNLLWRSKLPGLGYSLGHSMMPYQHNIVIGGNGKVGAIDRDTGVVRWTRNLPKWYDYSA